ncbi:LacI family DNA-binding transcriptional regulator [Dactylosporangium sp. CS-033363]|uniref:LacI family DNA-binding transcriptional regulator n=1 Tax=Dactylosporangium sp. CS-033363 TaxID=3239935 RepID=UPI003D90F076
MSEDLGAAAPRRPGRPASIRDVAQAAGVSYQTVSRVINSHPRVAPVTRELVLRSIRELGFRPNRAARALAGGQIDSIGVLTSNTMLYGYASTIAGIEQEARRNGLSIGITVLAEPQPAAVRAAVERTLMPGGAVVVLAFDRAGELALAVVEELAPALGVRVAAALQSRGDAPDPARPWCWLDDRVAAREATRYLLDLGHATVHYIELPSSTGEAQRTAGWREALLEAGIDPPVPVPGGWDCAAGYRAGRALAADPAVTAVLCGNDDLAVGVLSALREAGRPVPASVSVVGFDDMPQSAYLAPALTTVRLDFVGLGRDCVALLDPAGGFLPPIRRAELIVRRSSGPS